MLRAKMAPTLKSLGPHSKVGGQVSVFDRALLSKIYEFCNFFDALPKTSVDDVIERRRRERNCCYILHEFICFL